MNADAVIGHTRRWIETIVIGLNLCPFAERVFASDRIRFAVTDAANETTLEERLTEELDRLANAPANEMETTLLIHPLVLGDFLAYNNFLDVADAVVRQRRLTGVIQIASFHPRYQFAGTDADAVENYTNRSPYPMLHLLREASIAAAAVVRPLDDIPGRNIETLRQIGLARIQALLAAAACEPSTAQTNTRLL